MIKATNFAKFAVQVVKQTPLRLHGAQDGLPIPPPKLLYLVAGTADVAWFLQSGSLAASSMQDILAKNGITTSQFEAVLDFGCGCGRVIRHLSSWQTTKLYGVDYNPQLIKWCQRNLRSAQFMTNDLNPPLSYANAAFDFIYALSVFTHMPEALQLAWMSELTRVLKPGGLLLITTHGDYYLQYLTSDEQAQYRAGHLVIHFEIEAGSNTCAAFHPVTYVREYLACGLTVIDHGVEGAKGNPRQDVLLLRKPIDLKLG